MQLSAQSEGSHASSSAGPTEAPDPSESDYVGKHRPHRMSLRRQRGRVGQLGEPAAATPK